MSKRADELDPRDQIISEQAQDIAQLQLNNAALHAEMMYQRDRAEAAEHRADALERAAQMLDEEAENLRHAAYVEEYGGAPKAAEECRDAARVVERQARAIRNLQPDQPAPHDLYKTGDYDAPEVIKDDNGEVVLGLCRRCGRGEVELEEPCDQPVQDGTVDTGGSLDGFIDDGLPEDHQPADAGEPNTRPRCSHTRLVKNHCPVCGPLDDDNRSVTDGDKATPDAAAAIRGEADKGRSIRQQISEAQEEVAAWPEWMTKSAKVHEPSCCARTREECARVAEGYPVLKPFGSNFMGDGRFLRGQKRSGLEIADAIRRTGDTGGGDE